MPQFRKKPVVITANQFNAADSSTHEHVNFGTFNPDDEPHLVGKFWIPTLEGWHEVTDGDWIITGVKGEHYTCKPDIFALTYELVQP